LALLESVMRIAVLAETDKSEPRVAATPETTKKFVGLGAEVAVQAGAGASSGFSTPTIPRRARKLAPIPPRR